MEEADRIRCKEEEENKFCQSQVQCIPGSPSFPPKEGESVNDLVLTGELREGQEDQRQWSDLDIMDELEENTSRAATSLPCSTDNGPHGNIPKDFFNHYFGCAAFVYSLMTIWVFLFDFLESESFAVSGLFYMLAIAGLLWLSTFFVFIVGHFSPDIGIKTLSQFGSACICILALPLKLVTDCAICYGCIIALIDPDLNHYHEFSQFVCPILYIGLLYLVIVIGVVVIFITTIIMKDVCGVYVLILKIIEVMDRVKAYLRSKFPLAVEV